ncbi:MAG TPA: hypothetical protein DEA08_12310 [Planctomycetes bacterium]|nr:hypothetical protein [Planctomycetota bacterium]
MTLTRTALALLGLFCLAPLAHAQETYSFSGTVDGYSAQGRITFARSADDPRARQPFGVQQTLRVSGERISLSGQGRWVNDERVLATLGTQEGIANRLGSLSKLRGKSLVVSFTRGPDGKWWAVRGSLDETLWLSAWGNQRAAEPGELTISNARHGEVAGTPFLKAPGDAREIEADDVRQGQLGSCYLLAGMAAVAHMQPERIRSRIRAIGPDASEVKIRDTWYRVSHKPALTYGSPVYARGDSIYRDGQRVYELWPSLIEKAAALQRGGYESVESGPTWRGLNMLGYDTDSIVCTLYFGLSKRLRKALDRKQPIVVGFPPYIDRTSLGKELGIVPLHAYALVAKQGKGFVLLNPWGHSHPSRPLTASDLRKLLASISIAK